MIGNNPQMKQSATATHLHGNVRLNPLRSDWRLLVYTKIFIFIDAAYGWMCSEWKWIKIKGLSYTKMGDYHLICMQTAGFFSAEHWACSHPKWIIFAATSPPSPFQCDWHHDSGTMMSWDRFESILYRPLHCHSFTVVNYLLFFLFFSLPVVI